LPVEIRWFRSDTELLWGGVFYKLGTSVTGTGAYNTKAKAGTYSYVLLGIQVWKVDVNGNETLLSGGIVAQVRFDLGEMYTTKIGQWTHSAFSLQPTDRIIVRFYENWNGQAWESFLLNAFITEQLNASQLDAGTWDVYYSASFYQAGTPVRTFREFYWDNYWDSRIENFSWTPYTAVAKKPIMDGFVFIE
jgi:hypothetical protein